jgi:hypothetical protein
VRREEIDARALMWGIVLGGVLSVGFATAFLYLARTSDVGVGETISTAVGLGILVLVVVTVASALGAGAGHAVRGRRA